MRNIRYWLLLKLAQTPKAFTYGAGILIAFALMAGAVVVITWLDHNRVAQRHLQAARMFQDIAAESTALLDHLQTHETMVCNDADLLHLNAHLLEARYLREIGLMDEDRRLVCSTSLGELETPVKGDYPVHVSYSGLELLKNVPLQMADQKLSAMIMVKAPFNVVISPFATHDIYMSADTVWLRTQDALTLLHTRVDAQTLAGMNEHASLRQGSTLKLRWTGYELITPSPSQDIVLQTRRSLPGIIDDSDMLLPSLLAGSLLIAVLAMGTLAPHVRNLAHLRNRIDYLCNETHLTLVYQPIFDLSTMRPVGCEVLARLKENDKTWMPGDMISAIQQAGLESQFDFSVTRKAIREIAAHLPSGNGVFELALNYFPESIRQGTLMPVLSDALQATGRHDLKVFIEITEHSLSTEVIPEILALKAQGFQIAVDDFGTGYSNLKSVTQLSPDILKIDRSFVYDLEDASVRSSLIPEIINIARAVNAQIIAEGIETLEQARLLAVAGAHYGQGYALARPMDIAQLVAFMTRFK